MSPRSERPPPSVGKQPGKRGRRVVLAGLVVVAAGFIGSSTWQLAGQVFRDAPASFPVSAACAGSLRAFLDALDRGRARAALEPSGSGAERALSEIADPALASVAQDCPAETNRSAGGDDGGKDYEGFVAAKRLRDATLEQIEGDRSNLARFRRAVDMRLSP